MKNITSIGRRIWRNKKEILSMIKLEERYIKVLYTAIIGEIINIGRLARQNNGATIISDLTRYRDELNSLMADFDNDKIKSDLSLLVERINLFIEEYVKAGKGGILGGQEKISVIISFIVNTLNQTLLADLNQAYVKFSELEEAYSRAA